MASFLKKLFHRSYAYRQNVFSPVYIPEIRRLLCTSLVLKSETKDKMPVVGLSPDGNTVVCWHPEQKFPYEHTRPLPRRTVELSLGNSVLKVQHMRDQMTRYRRDGPTDRELANMFHTTKHRWFPMSGKKYIKPNPPKDRDGL